MMPQLAVPEFFHRFDGLGLVPGNKTAGFDVMVSTEILQRLQNLAISPAAHEHLLQEMRGRLSNAKLLSAAELDRFLVAFVPGTWCPRYFATGREGASVGADPSELERLPARDALEWIGPTLAYTPHNVDSPVQALALVVMVETWAEQARFALQSAML
jgi:hypothetical protein